MKTVLIIIVCLISLTASAGIYDTLGFKVTVPRISKADDRAVGIKITFDTTKKATFQKIIVKNEDGEGLAGANLSVVLDDDTMNALNLITDEEGKIVTNGISENKIYTVNATSVGYKSTDTIFSFKSLNEITILLTKHYVAYDSVVVTGVGIKRCRKIGCCCSTIVRTSEDCQTITTRGETNYLKIFPNPACPDLK